MTRWTVYVTEALRLGRPDVPCPCEECECQLHSYRDDEACVWCRNGKHDIVRTDGGESGTWQAAHSAAERASSHTPNEAEDRHTAERLVDVLEATKEAGQ